jgi:NAD(P)-dependent dehydrogenase (short-subunit alcohol dehydrogenase family)
VSGTRPAPGAPLAVITGTTHGIGRVTARELARGGARVLMLCRNVNAAAAVAQEIRAQVPGACVDWIACDLAALSSVRAAAAAVRERVPAIQLLINNAGMASLTHRFSTDGYELTFASNHLGPFLLTGLLLDRMAPSGRIINVASRAHVRGVMDLDTVTDPRARYRPLAAYARSKLANVMHTMALARRLDASSVTANCLHPGVVATHLLPPWVRLLQRLRSREVFDEERGARTTLEVARAPALAAVSGEYFDEHGEVRAASALARDREKQEELWSRSENWTGWSFAALSR